MKHSGKIRYKSEHKKVEDGIGGLCHCEVPDFAGNMQIGDTISSFYLQIDDAELKEYTILKVVGRHWNSIGIFFTFEVDQ